jgi:RNA-directed DNA polymerase
MPSNRHERGAGPALADRIAQMVVKRHLEPELDGAFDPDSYGYRPGKSAHQAVEQARKRCWQRDWVVDLDIESFLDVASYPNVKVRSIC